MIRKIDIRLAHAFEISWQVWLAFLATIVIVGWKAPAAMPATIISFLGAYFAYLALIFTRERFRLDLLDKRWDVYAKTLEFLSSVQRNGGIPQRLTPSDDRYESTMNGILAAHESFRGIGYHKTRSLFGPDIHSLFDELNTHYATLVSFHDSNEADKIDKCHQALLRIINITANLPELFKRYVYFGDYIGKDK